MKNDKNKNRRDFLLTYFEPVDCYVEVEVNGYWLIKQKGETGWNVAIYTKEAFNNRDKFKKERLI